MRGSRRERWRTVRFSTKAIAARQSADGVELDVLLPDGSSETICGTFLVGADGIGSVVRQTIGCGVRRYHNPGAIPDDLDHIRLPPGDARPLEHLLSIRSAGMVRADPHRGVWRALFPVDASLDDKDVTSPERGERLLQGAVPRREPYEVMHRTAYRVHERVASTYVKGRMVIAGDAAHVNNPLGGMGLNGGIHDAFNLAGKLIEVTRGASLDTLERYSRQRRKVALDVVQQTALRNRSILNTQEPAARRAYYDELRGIVADPQKHRDYVMRTSMIQSLRDVEKVQ